MSTRDLTFVIPTYRLRDVSATVDAYLETNASLGLALENSLTVVEGSVCDTDVVQQNLSRIVDDVVTEIKASLEVWPTLIEICFFEKRRRGLPETLVNNQRLRLR